MPEAKIFDKAEEAERREKLGFDREVLLKKKEELSKQLSELEEAKRSDVEKSIRYINTEIEELDRTREKLSEG